MFGRAIVRELQRRYDGVYQPYCLSSSVSEMIPDTIVMKCSLTTIAIHPYTRPWNGQVTCSVGYNDPLGRKIVYLSREGRVVSNVVGWWFSSWDSIVYMLDALDLVIRDCITLLETNQHGMGAPCSSCPQQLSCLSLQRG